VVERIAVDLSGVPETLLGNLGRRAAAARLGALKDPMALEVVDRLQYDFADSSRGARLHAVRVSTFDAAVRHFLGCYIRPERWLHLARAGDPRQTGLGTCSPARDGPKLGRLLDRRIENLGVLVLGRIAIDVEQEVLGLVVDGL
jgi:hypothetical protein